MVSASPKSIGTKPSKFFVVSDQYTRYSAPGLKIVNEQALIAPGMTIFYPPAGRRGFVDLPEMPKLTQLKGNRALNDLEQHGYYWVISEKAKQVFEEVDPEGFAFVSCDFTLPDGSKGDQRYLCDVVRELDAIDEDMSSMRIIIEQSGNKIYSAMGGARFIFKEQVVGCSHVFADVHYGGLLCDSILRDACKAAGLKGLLFREALAL